MEPVNKKARFAEAKSAEEIADLTKGYVPPNTSKNTSWAVKVFNDWHCERNEKQKESSVLKVSLTHQMYLNF